jgi:hypothetical protein
MLEPMQIIVDHVAVYVHLEPVVVVFVGHVHFCVMEFVLILQLIRTIVMDVEINAQLG